ARWVCEQAHQQLKEELGLDHFEGRSWRGLHRHALMARIAYAFLQHRRLAAASGGQKKRPRATSSNAAGHTKSHRRSPRARSALPMPPLPPTNPQIARMKVPK
ncbi:MAG: IS701 family transposase, partial [Roseiarcus sp.]